MWCGCIKRLSFVTQNGLKYQTRTCLDSTDWKELRCCQVIAEINICESLKLVSICLTSCGLQSSNWRWMWNVFQLTQVCFMKSYNTTSIPLGFIISSLLDLLCVWDIKFRNKLCQSTTTTRANKVWRSTRWTWITYVH